jgi:hypothetical protein
MDNKVRLRYKVLTYPELMGMNKILEGNLILLEIIERCVLLSRDMALPSPERTWTTGSHAQVIGVKTFRL